MKENKLINNVSFSILNSILSLFVSIASGMIIARILGPEGKGIFYLINQIITIGAVFFSLGLGPALLYFLKQNKFTKNQAISFSLLYSLVIVVLISILFLFLKDYIQILLNYSLSIEMIFFGLVLIILNLLITFWGYVLMDEVTGVKIFSIISLIGNLIYIFLLFTLVYGFANGIRGGLIALLISSLLKIVIIIRYLFRDGISYTIMPKRNIRPIFKYGFGIFIGNLFLTSVYRIDVFFVNNLLSVSDLGVYSASVNVSELLLLIPNAVGVALFPHLTSLNYQDRTLTMSKIGRLSTVLGIVGALLIIVIAYPFIIFIFGNEFKGAIIPTLYLLPGLVAMTLNYAYTNYLNSIGKPILTAKIFLAGLIVNIFLNCFFLKRLGINGAAIFSSITYIIITIGFILVILKNDKHLKFRDIAIPNGDDFNYIFNKLQQIIKLK